MLSGLYRKLTAWGAPAIRAYLRRRLAQGREDAARLPERLGQASAARPEGRLIWCHAASVGEAMSLLLLIEKMHAVNPDAAFLMTTGTVSAARMMATRLPSYVTHQYAPVDLPQAVESFLDHWQPDFAVWIESELWPNTLAALRARAVPVVLLNARMSDKSFRNWRRVKGWARELMSGFVLCLAQTEDDRGRYVALGARPARCLGNLKYAALPLPYDAVELSRLRGTFGARPVWLMASTHPGEEDLAAEAQKTLMQTRPDALLVLVPRHPARGDDIATALAVAGLRVARRSKGEDVTAETQIYLADTMGELGLFYRLCPVVVLGGSFTWGGHNPIEPAQLGAALIWGPQMFNFRDIAAEFARADAVLALGNGNEIAFAVARLWAEPHERDRLAMAARHLAEGKRDVLDKIVAELRPWLRGTEAT